MFVVHQARDVSDTMKIISCLRDRDPFSPNSYVLNIGLSVIDNELINVDSSKDILTQTVG